MRKILILAFLVFFIPLQGQATVIFQDNFDSVAENTYNTCGGQSGNVPPGWFSWYIMGDSGSATFDGVTHCGGEISTPGRGGTGQSLKTWRHSTYPTPNAYVGSMRWNFPGSPTYREIYMRYYKKVPTAMDFSYFNNYLKLWRFNLNDGEIYFNYKPSGSGSFRNTAQLEIYTATSGWVTLASNAQLPWDGNWHCYEVHLSLGTGANGTLRLWIDGNLLYSSNTFNYGTNANSYFSFIQHFGIGNKDEVSTNWQSSWQAFEFDDFVISTTYVGPIGGFDTIPPSIPTNLSATAVSSSQINLSWTASTDNVGVTGYRVERCQGSTCTNFTQIATPTGTSYSDTGLSAATTYRYRVRAVDAAGNLSSYSSIVSATTQTAPDTTPPTTPTGLTATSVSSSQINLSWTASTDNVGVTGYRIFRCQGTGCTPSTQISTSATNSYSDTGLTASTTYVYRVAAYDAVGNVSGQSSSASATTIASQVNILFEEPFENTNFTSRGWYDAPSGTISNTVYKIGNGSFECRFLAGGQGCSGGSPARHGFTATESVYVSFWVRFSPNWVGSGRPYHPHIFYILSDQDGAYAGPAWNYTNAYIEFNGLTPRIALQDARNIDTGNIGVNLCNITENRAVNGCNGNCDTNPATDCYSSGGYWYNGRSFDAASPLFTRENWHFVEAYFQMNTISGGKGQADGVVQYWVDGQQVINRQNVIIRTNQHAAMKFNQFIISPWIGDGSPVDQTFWIDHLTVATGRSSDVSPPLPPRGLMIQ